MHTFEEVLPLIEDSYGEECCRKRVRFGNSISLGFGKKVYHEDSSLIDNFYGEWNYGCYHKLWRIKSGNETILQGWDDFENYLEIDRMLQQLDFGRLVKISIIEGISLIIELDNDLSVEFFPDKEDDDEDFHAFLPDDKCLAYYFNQGWEYD
ncbi:hypothetical protein ACTXMK_10165 [Psychrobacter celer]|uniref:hypothetical protein n=1 Tax=Psychrobacter celer TaxID=306572 RepID=UPI003FD113C9